QKTASWLGDAQNVRSHNRPNPPKRDPKQASSRQSYFCVDYMFSSTTFCGRATFCSSIASQPETTYERFRKQDPRSQRVTHRDDASLTHTQLHFIKRKNYRLKYFLPRSPRTLALGAKTRRQAMRRL